MIHKKRKSSHHNRVAKQPTTTVQVIEEEFLLDLSDEGDAEKEALVEIYEALDDT